MQPPFKFQSFAEHLRHLIPAPKGLKQKKLYPEKRGNLFLQNTGTYVLDCKTPQKCNINIISPPDIRHLPLCILTHLTHHIKWEDNIDQTPWLPSFSVFHIVTQFCEVTCLVLCSIHNWWLCITQNTIYIINLQSCQLQFCFMPIIFSNLLVSNKATPTTGRSVSSVQHIEVKQFKNRKENVVIQY